MPLSDAAIKKARYSRDDGKPERLTDEKGMYLELSPAGGKLWRLKYCFGGKEKRLALGAYPEVGLKAAREKRDAARALLAEGIDPGTERKIQKSAKNEQATNSFEYVAREWLAKNAATWAESHTMNIMRRLERDVFPWVGSREMTAINAAELLSVLRRIEERGAHETAHRVRENCGQIFRYGIDRKSVV